MPFVIEAIYKGGVLKPKQPLDISENTLVKVIVEPKTDVHKSADQILALARQSCENLSKEELAAIESVRLRSESFFRLD